MANFFAKVVIIYDLTKYNLRFFDFFCKGSVKVAESLTNHFVVMGLSHGLPLAALCDRHSSSPQKLEIFWDPIS